MAIGPRAIVHIPSSEIESPEARICGAESIGIHRKRRTDQRMVSRAFGFETLTLNRAPPATAGRFYGAIAVVNFVTSDGFDDSDAAILPAAAVSQPGPAGSPTHYAGER